MVHAHSVEHIETVKGWRPSQYRQSIRKTLVKAPNRPVLNVCELIFQKTGSWTNLENFHRSANCDIPYMWSMPLPNLEGLLQCLVPFQLHKRHDCKNSPSQQRYNFPLILCSKTVNTLTENFSKYSWGKTANTKLK